MNEWILISMVILAEAFLHYFPWKKLLRRELPRVAAYALGVLGLMIPFTVWLLEQDQTAVTFTLWKVIIAGGVIVAALYGLDRYIELEWRDMESNERERALRTGHGTES